MAGMLAASTEPLYIVLLIRSEFNFRKMESSPNTRFRKYGGGSQPTEMHSKEESMSKRKTKQQLEIEQASSMEELKPPEKLDCQTKKSYTKIEAVETRTEFFIYSWLWG